MPGTPGASAQKSDVLEDTVDAQEDYGKNN